MTDISLRDEVAVVTGAGAGLGEAEAIELARRGARVVVNDVLADRAQRVAGAIVEGGGSAVACASSIATPAGGAAVIDCAREAFGAVSIVINNAGILRPGWFEDLSFDRINEVLDVHLRGVFHVTQPAWRLMKANGYGRIVMTGSSSGLFSNQMTANYAAAKGGIYGLTKALAYEGADVGIKVNVVLPYADTLIRTSDASAMMEPYAASMAEAFERHRTVPKPAGAMEGRTDPQLTAALVAYLASRSCEPSGEAFSVCYGRFARVFVGVADGWLAPDPATVTAEDIVSHLASIRDLRSHEVPMYLFDEAVAVEARLAQLDN